MNIYENIPTLVTEAVRSMYQQSYVDFKSYDTARIWDFLGTNGTVLNISAILSRASLILCIVFITILVVVRLKQRALRTTQTEQPSGEEHPAEVPIAGVLQGQWGQIAEHLNSNKESDWKIAVIEADKLVDDALAHAGFSGDTFGDRLSNIQPEDLQSLDGVWWAHKVRNRLVHEADYFLRYTEAKQAVGYYEVALAELKLI